MIERPRDESHYDYDREMLIPPDDEQRLQNREALRAEQAQRQEKIRSAIQEILGKIGPMRGTDLYIELNGRFPDISTDEFRNARLYLGYPLDPIEIFTLKRD